MSIIINEIFGSATLSEIEAEAVDSQLHRLTISKGDYLLKPGQEVDSLYYIHSGCLRNYIIDFDGKEHTLQFAAKGWWTSDYIALYGKNKIPAQSYIECLKDAVLYSISKPAFDKLCRDYPNVGQLHTRKMELAFASFQNRILENLTLSAKDRYINFITAYPSFANDVKNYHIASYLGITTESLSRIRKELASA